MCLCVYLGPVHMYRLFCVLPSQAFYAGEYSSPSLTISSPEELKIARGRWRRGLPRGPLSTPPPRGSFPSFLESYAVIGLSLAKFPPVLHPQEGLKQKGTRTQLNPVPSPRNTAALGRGASFLGKTSWLVQSYLRIPPLAALWGMGEAQRLLDSLAPAGLFSVLVNPLRARWGPCCAPGLPSVWWAAGVRTWHSGSVPASWLRLPHPSAH